MLLTKIKVTCKYELVFILDFWTTNRIEMNWYWLVEFRWHVYFLIWIVFFLTADAPFKTFKTFSKCPLLYQLHLDHPHSKSSVHYGLCQVCLSALDSSGGKTRLVKRKSKVKTNFWLLCANSKLFSLQHDNRPLSNSHKKDIKHFKMPYLPNSKSAFGRLWDEPNHPYGWRLEAECQLKGGFAKLLVLWTSLSLVYRSITQKSSQALWGGWWSID